MNETATVDFLGIGAQRAASTWLANSLRTHPDVWLPPRKELHYFTRGPEYPSRNLLANNRTLVGLVRQVAKRSTDGRVISRDLKRAVGRGSVRDLRWLHRYYLSAPDDEWYLSLFPPSPALVKGEITPDYSMLTAEDVRGVRRVAPDAKVIFVMRNPIDRAWSQVRLHWKRGAIDPTDIGQVLAFLDSQSQQLRSDYVRTLEAWRSAFGPDRMFVGYFDEIIEDATKTLDELAHFLNISPGGFTSAERINVAPTRDIPEAVEIHLARRYSSMLTELSAMVDDAPVVGRWIDDVDQVLARTSSN